MSEITSNGVAGQAAAYVFRHSGANSNAQQAGKAETARSVGSALKTAQSAYKNERFASVLEQLSDPRSAIAVALMRAEAGASADPNWAQARYAENS